MNAGLLRKTARDTLPLLLLAVAGLLLFEMLFVKAIGDFASEMLKLWERQPFLKNMIQLLVGARFGVDVSTTGLVTIGMSHPLLLAMTWAFILTTCSRVLAGEIDRGTADLLLTLPVSRAGVYTTVTLVVVLSGALLSAVPLCGIALGSRLFPMEPPVEPGRLLIPAVNLLAMYLAVAGTSLFFSSVLSRRGNVVAILMTLLLLSFLVNFLEALWQPAQRVAVLGILRYYRPLAAVQDGAWPVRDLVVLMTAATVTWLAGLIVYVRRDIPA